MEDPSSFSTRVDELSDEEPSALVVVEEVSVVTEPFSSGADTVVDDSVEVVGSPFSS